MPPKGWEEKGGGGGVVRQCAMMVSLAVGPCLQGFCRHLAGALDKAGARILFTGTMYWFGLAHAGSRVHALPFDAAPFPRKLPRCHATNK